MNEDTLLYLREALLDKIKNKEIVLNVQDYGRQQLGKPFIVTLWPHVEAVKWRPRQRYTYYKPFGTPIRVGIVKAMSHNEALYYARAWAKQNKLGVRQITVIKKQ